LGSFFTAEVFWVSLITSKPRVAPFIQGTDVFAFGLAWLGEFLQASLTKAKAKSVGIRQRTERNRVENIRADQGGLIAPNVNQRTTKVLRINGHDFLEKTSKKVQFPPRQFAI
jgi:hypothetical protein